MRVLPALLLSSLLLAVSVPIAHYDFNQTGANTSESVITPANVSRLKRLGAWTTNGMTMGQPLFIPAVTISGTPHDLLIVTTMPGTIYAFDAQNVGSAALWSRTFSNPRVTYPGNAGQFPFAYGQPLGIVSTPYVDTANSVVYVCMGDETSHHTLYQLSLTTGAILQSVVIAGSVSGIGEGVGDDCDISGQLSFCSFRDFVQRPGLVASNSKVYICFGATDTSPWHGFILAYNTSDFTQAGIWSASPNGQGGSVWISGAAPAIDGNGNLYVVMGNGAYDDSVGNYGESIVKLSPTLAVLDWFTPTDWATLNTNDQDMGSNHATLIPGTNFLIHVSKDYTARLIDTTCMGHLGGTVGCSAPQTWNICNACASGKATGAYSQIYMNGVWTIATTGQDADSFGGTPAGSLFSFAFGGGTFNTTALATNTASAWPFPGPAQIAGSSNASAGQIIWAVTGAGQTFTTTVQGTLRAFDTTLTELWNSGNTLGLMVKYAAPTVANGKVFVATQSNQVVVFGFAAATPSGQASGLATLSGNATLQ